MDTIRKSIKTNISLSPTRCNSPPPPPLVGQGLLINETSRSHSVGLLWTSDQPDAENST